MNHDLAELRDGKALLGSDFLWEQAVGKRGGSRYKEPLSHPTQCLSPLDRFPCRRAQESAHTSPLAGRPVLGLLYHGEGLP